MRRCKIGILCYLLYILRVQILTNNLLIFLFLFPNTGDMKVHYKPQSADGSICEKETGGLNVVFICF